MFKPGEPKASLRVWLRSAGAGSVLLGVVGLVQTFFLLTTCAVYFALGLFALDAMLENLRFRSKVIVLAALVAVGFAFTKYVVLHKSPIEFSYIASNDLDLIITNTSDDDDYHDLDLTVTPDQSTKIYVMSATQVVPGPPCTFISSPDQIEPHDGTLVVSNGHGYDLYPYKLRIRCDLLPHRSRVRFEVQLISTLNAPPPTPVAPRNSPAFEARFKGKFKVIVERSIFKNIG